MTGPFMLSSTDVGHKESGAIPERADGASEAASWIPVWPAVGVDLDVRQQLACAARILARIGFSENYAGHISCLDPASGHFWCTPWGKWWDEMCASDVILVAMDGSTVSGSLGVTPAIHIHTGLHEARPDAVAIVHNHPRFGTLLASHGTVPVNYTQTGLILENEIRLVREYTGAISTRQQGRELAARAPDGTAFLLANHGVITVGETVAHAVFKADILETVCRQHYDMRVLGGVGLIPMPDEQRQEHGLKKVQADISVRAYWEGAVRQLVRTEPGVLD
jgi:ribulose-5-phosphate 4-epimerase/fuculose-1-phosphate aldolase